MRHVAALWACPARGAGAAKRSDPLFTFGCGGGGPPLQGTRGLTTPCRYSGLRRGTRKPPRESGSSREDRDCATARRVSRRRGTHGGRRGAPCRRRRGAATSASPTGHAAVARRWRPNDWSVRRERRQALAQSIGSGGSRTCWWGGGAGLCDANADARLLPRRASSLRHRGGGSGPRWWPATRNISTRDWCSPASSAPYAFDSPNWGVNSGATGGGAEAWLGTMLPLNLERRPPHPVGSVAGPPSTNASMTWARGWDSASGGIPEPVASFPTPTRLTHLDHIHSSTERHRPHPRSGCRHRDVGRLFRRPQTHGHSRTGHGFQEERDSCARIVRRPPPSE